MLLVLALSPATCEMGFSVGSDGKKKKKKVQLQCRRPGVQSLGREDPLEKGRATHSSILAWRIPWTVESMRSERVRHN